MQLEEKNPFPEKTQELPHTKDEFINHYIEVINEYRNHEEGEAVRRFKI